MSSGVRETRQQPIWTAAPASSGGLIPIRLIADTRPIAGADGSDAVRVVDEEVPSRCAGIEDGLVAVPYAGAELLDYVPVYADDVSGPPGSVPISGKQAPAGLPSRSQRPVHGACNRAVGLTEAEAAAQGSGSGSGRRGFPQRFTARRLAEPVYRFKTLVEEGTGRILGAHLVGPGAEEVINLFGLAIRHDLTAEVLKSTMFAYPTAASDIGSML